MIYVMSFFIVVWSCFYSFTSLFYIFVSDKIICSREYFLFFLETGFQGQNKIYLNFKLFFSPIFSKPYEVFFTLNSQYHVLIFLSDTAIYY